MILNIRVIPKAGRNLVKQENNCFKEGLANRQLISLLAEYLKVKKYRIRIIKGEKFRDKVIEVADVL